MLHGLPTEAQTSTAHSTLSFCLHRLKLPYSLGQVWTRPLSKSVEDWTRNIFGQNKSFLVKKCSLCVGLACISAYVCVVEVRVVEVSLC